MSHTVSATELRNMQLQDLEHETSAKRMEVRKMKIGISLSKEKNTAKYRREKRLLARMCAILAEKKKQSLPQAPAAPTVSAPKKSSSRAKRS